MCFYVSVYGGVVCFVLILDARKHAQTLLCLSQMTFCLYNSFILVLISVGKLEQKGLENYIFTLPNIVYHTLLWLIALHIKDQ